MEREKSVKQFSILFLGVFFIKMLLSAAPLIVSHFDKQTVNAVIMQLEIENNAKSNDVKEVSVKEYFTFNGFRLTMLDPINFVFSEVIKIDHDKHIQAFHPPVPTPPPNV